MSEDSEGAAVLVGATDKTWSGAPALRSNLSSGWEWTTLGELCFPSQYGWTTKARRSGELKFLRTTDISRGAIDWDGVPYCTEVPEDLGRYSLQAGDLVISRSGSVGVSALIDNPPPAVFASYLIRFRPRTPQLGRYLKLFLQSPAYWGEIADRAVGIGMNNVNAKKLAAIPVPLPPQAEQDRIVEAIETLSGGVNAGRISLEAAVLRINWLRQALSALAFSGGLTGQEPGSRGFPDAWDTATLGDLASRITSGSRDWKPYYGRGPGVFIMAQNVRMRRLDFSEVFFVDPPRTDAACSRSAVQKGDVLVTIVGAGTGTVARVPSDLPEHWVCQSVALIRPTSIVSSEFLELFLASPGGGQDAFARAMYGQGRPHLGFDDLREVVVPVPPLDTQGAIVAAIASYEASIATMLATTSEAEALSRRLHRSILRDAFAGRLVPQDRAEEPASALLDRIRSERGRAAVAARQRQSARPA